MKKTTLIISMLLMAWCLSNTAHAVTDEVEYVYDDLNRISKVIYGDPALAKAEINYQHDMVNNRLVEYADTDGDGAPDDVDPDLN
ncbi:MAG: hypothetical protein KKG47_08785 [Proteobacteria bacterium]|nr:hypothetical protein [Pseudomonadota bacterium]MBU1736740.1 hypothetical protein [Pseudomonadota bacterium]